MKINVGCSFNLDKNGNISEMKHELIKIDYDEQIEKIADFYANVINNHLSRAGQKNEIVKKAKHK